MSIKNKSSNVAVVSNNTFEATKAVNLHNYDLTSALQTSLDFNVLLNIFSEKIKHLIPHNGFVYSNEDFELKISQGIVTKNSYTYSLKVEDTQLGRLKIMRHQRFTEDEIKLLETLLCSLIYPLKNATLFNQAVRMAHTDPLTKTLNRAALKDSLQREIDLAKRNSRHLSIIFFDLDHFKAINDEYGHECGDIALTAAATCIKDSTRCSDLLFRYGGEEFVLLLSDTQIYAARFLAERIRRRIENHTISCGMKTLKLTASLGISSLKDNDTPESLISRADKAMYQAKDRGRNQVKTELSLI